MTYQISVAEMAQDFGLTNLTQEIDISKKNAVSCQDKSACVAVGRVF